MSKRFIFIPLVLFVVAFFFVSPRAQSIGRKWLIKGVAFIIEFLEEIKKSIFDSGNNNSTYQNKDNEMLRAPMRPHPFHSVMHQNQPLNKGMINVLSMDYIRRRLQNAANNKIS